MTMPRWPVRLLRRWHWKPLGDCPDCGKDLDADVGIRTPPSVAVLEHQQARHAVLRGNAR